MNDLFSGLALSSTVGISTVDNPQVDTDSFTFDSGFDFATEPEELPAVHDLVQSEHQSGVSAFLDETDIEQPSGFGFIDSLEDTSTGYAFIEDDEAEDVPVMVTIPSPIHDCALPTSKEPDVSFSFEPLSSFDNNFMSSISNSIENNSVNPEEISNFSMSCSNQLLSLSSQLLAFETEMSSFQSFLIDKKLTVQNLQEEASSIEAKANSMEFGNESVLQSKMMDAQNDFQTSLNQLEDVKSKMIDATLVSRKSVSHAKYCVDVLDSTVRSLEAQLLQAKFALNQAQQTLSQSKSQLKSLELPFSSQISHHESIVEEKSRVLSECHVVLEQVTRPRLFELERAQSIKNVAQNMETQLSNLEHTLSQKQCTLESVVFDSCTSRILSELLKIGLVVEKFETSPIEIDIEFDELFTDLSDFKSKFITQIFDSLQAVSSRVPSFLQQYESFSSSYRRLDSLQSSISDLQDLVDDLLQTQKTIPVKIDSLEGVKKALVSQRKFREAKEVSDQLKDLHSRLETLDSEYQSHLKILSDLNSERNSLEVEVLQSRPVLLSTLTELAGLVLDVLDVLKCLTVSTENRQILNYLLKVFKTLESRNENPTHLLETIVANLDNLESLEATLSELIEAERFDDCVEIDNQIQSVKIFIKNSLSVLTDVPERLSHRLASLL
ncbi:hypothetical protein RCL1_000971 [Eukaryota sp. TZLM3-RCL]